jgi:hypothetical protein
MNIRLIAFIIGVGCARAAAPDGVLHVAPGGSDGNLGTASQPFATLERARQAVRSAASDQIRQVIVHGGRYELRDTFTLGERDSGTAVHPVTWQAAPGETVRLIGGTSVPASAWRTVTDGAVLDRLESEARSQVRQVELRELGITHLPPFPDAYHGVPPGPELFFNQERLNLARWPNAGWATIDRIIESGSRPRDGDQRGLTGVFEYAGDRPARWQAAEGVWLQGYWCYDWYDEVIQVSAIDPATRQIRLAAPHVYGLMQGNPSPRRYRALNVLEELDQPGEYVIDRPSGRLYLWPPAELAGAEVLLSTLDQPVVALENASHLVWRGFVIEAGLNDGITVTGGAACEIAACELRNLRRQGIRVNGGTKHRVLDCKIHHTGQGGLVLDGGDRKTLTPAGHEAVNNHIWRFSELQLTSAYGLSFGGVGNRAAHNLIHDAPHQAVFVGGNDHLFEFNEVHGVCTETDDCGALYKGRNPSCRGNMIRYNYWHDIGSPMGHGNAAIYFDDGDGGDSVFGNLFVRCGVPGRGSFGTIFSHGGHDNRAENNIFIDCKRALGSAPWDDARWRDALRGGQDCFFVEKLQQEVDITKPPYTTRYPELIGYLDPPADVPRVNRARNNVMVRGGEVAGGNWRLDPGTTWSTDEDPGFVDAAGGDYRLRPDAAVFQRLPGFEPVPFEKMGLRGAASVAEGFVALFNGVDLDGWELWQADNRDWRVVDGIIDCDPQESPGDRNLWTTRSFGNFELLVDWRITQAPYTNHAAKAILPDGTYQRDASGNEIAVAVPNVDSGIFLRGQHKSQVNLWCWPVGSGEVWGYRTDPALPPEIRAGVTPRVRADRPIGEWNTFHIILVGDRLTVRLNDRLVLDGARLPGIPERGPIALQHHGDRQDGEWGASFVQFRRIYLREIE